jgi:hypothetical protein
MKATVVFTTTPFSFQFIFQFNNKFIYSQVVKSAYHYNIVQDKKKKSDKFVQQILSSDENKYYSLEYFKGKLLFFLYVLLRV